MKITVSSKRVGRILEPLKLEVSDIEVTGSGSVRVKSSLGGGILLQNKDSLKVYNSGMLMTIRDSLRQIKQLEDNVKILKHNMVLVSKQTRGKLK